MRQSNWSRRAFWLRAALAAPLVLVVVGTLGATGGPVSAADDEADVEARRRFRRGTKLFDDGKFREAAHEFESGYAVLPRTGFLLNIGHSYRRAGDLKKAKRYYELFLQQETESPRQRAEAAEYIKLVEEGLAEQTGEEPPEYNPPPPVGNNKDKLGAKSDVKAPLVMSADELDRMCRARGADTPWVPWVVAGAAAVIAAGLGAALLITNRGK